MSDTTIATLRAMLATAGALPSRDEDPARLHR